MIIKMNVIPRLSIFKNIPAQELSSQNECKFGGKAIRTETDPSISKSNNSNTKNPSKNYFDNNHFTHIIKPIKRKSHHTFLPYSESKMLNCDKISQSKENVESNIIEKEKHKIENFLKEKISLNKKLKKKKGLSDNSHHINKSYLKNIVLSPISSETNKVLINNTSDLNISNDSPINKKSSSTNFPLNASQNMSKETSLNDIFYKYMEKNNVIEKKSIQELEKQKMSILFFKHNLNLEDEKRNIKKKTKTMSDSLEDEDENVLFKIKEKGNFLIFPNSAFKNIWDNLIRLFFLYSLVYSPLFLAFSNKCTNPFNSIVEIVIDGFFILDIFIYFFVPYYDFEDNLILDRFSISRNYLNNYFMFDLLAAIPFNTYSISIQISSNDNQRIDKNIYNILQLMRITKLYSLLYNYSSKTEDSSDWFKDNNISSGVKRLSIFSVIFLMVSHIISCIWIFLADLDTRNWISSSNLRDLNRYEIYIAAVYFNWTTIFTIGYGDILSCSIYERIYNILIMMIGVLLYSFAVSSLGTMFTTYDEITAKYLKNLEILDEIKAVNPGIDILQEREENSIQEEFEEEEWEEEIIPWRKSKQKNTLYMKLKKFLNYDYKFNKTDKVNFIKDLPNKTRNELLKEMHPEMIQFSSFFKNNYLKHKNDAFTSKVILNMYPISARKEEFLIKKGEIVQEMLLVKSGKLSIEDQIGEHSYRILSLTKHDYFGVISLLNNEKSEINVRVKSKSAEIYLLKKKDLLEISKEFPKIFKEIFKASSINYSIIKQLIFNKREKFNLERTIMKQQKSKISKKDNLIIIEKKATNLNIPSLNYIQDLDLKVISNPYLKKDYYINQDSELNNPSVDPSNEYIIKLKKTDDNNMMNMFGNPLSTIREFMNSKKGLCCNFINTKDKTDSLSSNFITENPIISSPIVQRNKLSSRTYKGNGSILDNSIITSDKNSLERNLIDSNCKDSGRILNNKKPKEQLIRYGSEIICSSRRIEEDPVKSIQRISLKESSLNHSLDKTMISKISQTVKSNMKQNKILEKNPKKFIYNEFKNLFHRHLVSEKHQYENLISKLDVLFNTLKTKYDRHVDIK